jgi:excisionase family DNA binding protein
MNIVTMRETNIPVHRFQYALKTKKLKGQKVGGVYVFTQAQIAAWTTGKPPVDADVQLFSPREAAAYLEVGQRAIYDLIRDGRLQPVKEIKGQGKMPLKILAQEQLDAIRPEAEKLGKGTAGRPVSDNVDLLIDERDGEFYIRDSRDRSGKEYRYRNRHQARWKARSMKYGPTQHFIGDEVYVSGRKGDPVRTGTVIATVSHIDKTALIAFGKEEELVPVRYIRGLTEKFRERNKIEVPF